MIRRSSRNAFVWIVVLCLTFSSVGLVSATAKDVKGHWAEWAIESWTNQGLVGGYEDGTFRPEVKVNRQEFTALVNRSFSFVERGVITFTDVALTDWSYSDISKAEAAGYIAGYIDGTFGPKKEISRQEVAVIISRLLVLGSSSSADLFVDTKNSAAWSKSALGAAYDQGIMVGYPDGTFRPEKAVTRAEAVVLLDRAIKVKAAMNKTTTYNEAGTYGPLTGVQTIDGNVVISAQDVKLQNVTITGDLLLAASIGEGNVFLKKVTVLGKTTVKGGGVNSIYLEDSILNTVLVNKPNGSVRIVASGSTKVEEITLQSSTILEESNLTSEGFKDVNVSETMREASNVKLDGDFVNVSVNANNITMDIPTGSVSSLSLNAASTGTSVNLGTAAHINSLILNAAVSITGQGTINNAEFNKSGASVTQTPKTIKVANNVSATVNGSAAITTPTTPTPSAPTPSTTTQSSSKAMKSFNFIGLTPNVIGVINEEAKTIALTVPFGTDVSTLDPSIATTGTSMSPNTGVSQNFETSVTYTVYAEDGTTRAYVVSVAAKSTVTGGAKITIIAPEDGVTAWLAPANTKVFAEAGHMTKLDGDGLLNTIVSPATLGDYKLFLVNSLQVGVEVPVGTLTVAAGWGVNLGTSGGFAILSKTGITNTGNTTITGNIGVSPIDATAITGFALDLVSGSEYATSSTVVGAVYAPEYASSTLSKLTTAVSNMETAYTDASGRAPNYTELYSGDISGRTLMPGVYKWGTDVLINSKVTLAGGPDDFWIFQISGKLTQAAATQIILAGGAKSENIFWQVADTVAIGTTAHFEGIILAKTDITVGTKASINGRLLAQTAVTLDENSIVEF